jgi:ribonuclease HI
MALNNKFYAVANGRTIGIFLNWDDCHTSVIGYKNASYKKFDTKEEAEIFIISSNPNFSETKNKEQTSIPVILNTNKYDKNIDFIPDYYVYTDGGCANNGSKNAVAGIGIFFGINDHRNVSQKIEGKQTNNTAELSAIIHVYSIIENDIMNGKKVTIVSDSKYALQCVSSYGKKCYKNKWIDDIPNKELVKIAYEMYKNKLNIKFLHIKAHTNNSDIHSIGNKNADELASNAIYFENVSDLKRVKTETKKTFSIEDEIVVIKNDIKELKNTLKELVDMMKAVYEFEDS